MDDYLVKPVRAREIYDKLESLFGKRAALSPAPPPASTPPLDAALSAHQHAHDAAKSGRPSAIDWDSAIAVVDGDRELLGEIVAAFLIEGPTLLEQIRRALAVSDSAQLRREAHTLKGALRTLGIELAAELAAELEEIGRRGDLSAAPARMARLESQVDQILSEAKSFASAPQTS
jgi:HPt (histidine-containing phosphotransfer) domain-containing protein